MRKLTSSILLFSIMNFLNVSCTNFDAQSTVNEAPIVIVVHGTWSYSEKWLLSQNRLSFLNGLRKSTEIPNTKVLLFGWDGSLSPISRLEVAKELAKFILLNRHRPIHLVGHSFGANIINQALLLINMCKNYPQEEELQQQANELSMLNKKESSLSTLLNPIKWLELLHKSKHEKAAQSIDNSHPSFGGITTLHTTDELVKNLGKKLSESVLRLLKATIQDVKNMAIKTNWLHEKETHPLVNSVTLIATPINTIVYPPNSNLTKSTCHLFSKKDPIQQVGWIYPKHSYKNTSKINNIHVLIAKTPTNVPRELTHNEFTKNKTIGTWLLKIPELIQERGLNKFGNVISMIFYEDNSPPHVSFE